METIVNASENSLNGAVKAGVVSTTNKKERKNKKTEKTEMADIPHTGKAEITNGITEKSVGRKKKVKGNSETQKLITNVSQLQTLVESLTLTESNNAALASTLTKLKENASLIKDGVNQVVQSHQPVKVKHTRQSANTGLGKPRVVTKDLAKFLGCDYTDLKSRNDVTKAICEYISANNLQVPDNKKMIKCDAILIDLLRLNPDETYTYTGLQSHFNHLFIEKTADPTLYITDTLITFSLENKGPVWTKDVLVSWDAVNKFFDDYIKEHDLKDPDNRRKVMLDDRLKTLFKINPSGPITKALFGKYCKQLVTEVTTESS
ncbi:SWIB complex BAF60b domain-containing protein [Armadillidium vulgare iridescent virus]|uniref:SWIB complex BAF60b domain-containing protein n=1 Tax=Armadillidium vulgare iridescent virus TaxID=72201 RepID=A0A068QKS4_9VIRU|nr:SWIB complex BAF60b domain-containing protein [Armadillidium vulgare iridescent virus]CCV02551.1 SWIB complex BAF60b domain-containing protein [Armadillidium vulgare iridescent virus]